jgi:hypothetical protein
LLAGGGLHIKASSSALLDAVLTLSASGVKGKPSGSSAIDSAGDFGELSIVGKPWLATETFDNAALSFLGVDDGFCKMSEVENVYKENSAKYCYIRMITPLHN